VAVAAQRDWDLAWYENTNGAGAFGTKRLIANVAHGPYSVGIADLNGDGHLDVLSALGSIDTVAWFENLGGSGAFGAQQTITTQAEWAIKVLAVDMDGDGDLDTLSASDDDDRIAWYENIDGQGSYGPQHSVTDQAEGATRVAVADIDGDGDLDTLSASAEDDKIAWYENLSDTGAYGSQRVISDQVEGASAVFGADIDGDGDTDVVAAAEVDFEVVWFDNLDGAGTFGPARLIGTPHAPVSALGTDVDGDGDIDVVVAYYWTSMPVFQGLVWYENLDGNGTFSASHWIASAGLARSIHDADLDGDGDVDILMAATEDGQIDWCRNQDGLGNFGLRQTISTGGYPRSVTAGDVDGDGDQDVIAGYQADSQLSVFENLDGNGDFGDERVIATMVSCPHALAAADLDDDGDVDVVSAAYYDDRVFWLENVDGEGSFAPEDVITTLAKRPRSICTGDADGDGRLDVLVASEHDDRVSWYENLTDRARAVFRNAGTNPASYTTTLPVLGSTLTGTVDLAGTTGHDLAWLVGFATPLSLTLGGGQVLLLDFLDPRGELLGLPVAAGPVAVFDVLVPNLPIIVGWRLHAQALHFGSTLLPIALSNAYELTIGY